MDNFRFEQAEDRWVCLHNLWMNFVPSHPAAYKPHVCRVYANCMASQPLCQTNVERFLQIEVSIAADVESIQLS